jgi:hypothetical protein
MAPLLRTLVVLLGVALLVPAGAAAELTLQSIDSFDYDSPTYVTSEPGEPNRLYIVEQDGRIRLSVGGVSSAFLDIADLVRSPEDADGGNEQGLLSMAFSPNSQTTGLFYVFYTAQEGGAGALRIDEFDVDADPVESSRRAVIEVPHDGAAQNHNGGQLQFGPDGHLYASTGDGGAGNSANAQNVGSLLGKILRIAPAGASPGGYSVPAGNPFAGPTPGRDEIWSLGLRNPWRFSFDRVTGALTIGDVGQGSWEEVDFEPQSAGAGRGDNFGWNCREGMHDFATAPPCDDPPPFTEPIFEYANDGSTCAITGGYVVRDPALGDLLGRYVYADLCEGVVRSLCPAVPAATNARSEGVPVSTPTSFGEDLAGRIYVVQRGGEVSRLTGPAEEGQCPQTPPPPSGSPGDPGPRADTTAPGLTLRGERRHDLGDSRVLEMRASANEAADVELSAAVKPDRRGKFDLRDKSVGLPAGVEQRIKWRLSRREARRAKRRLRRGKKLSVRVRGRATDAAGNPSERESLKIRLGR